MTKKTPEVIALEIYKKVLLEDCPFCGGPGLLEEEAGSGWYAICLDCGSQTAEMEFKSPLERLEAAQKAADLWNNGKVLRMGMGD